MHNTRVANTTLITIGITKHTLYYLSIHLVSHSQHNSWYHHKIKNKNTTLSELLRIQYTIHLLSYNTQYTCYHATQNILATMQHTLTILPLYHTRRNLC